MATTQTPSSLLSQTMLKALLTSFDKQGTLISYLSEELAAPLAQYSPAPTTSFAQLLDITAWVQAIHYSWFLPYMQTLPQKRASTYFALFLAPAREALAQALNCPNPIHLPPPFAQRYLLMQLLQAVYPANLVPPPLLSAHPFSNLLSLREKSLLTLIDFLGLHDLAAEVKHLVDKQMLGKIQQALTPMEQKFLTYCTQQVIAWVPPRLNLQKWDGARATLQPLLQTRGLTRLAKALRGQENSLCWHVAHRFDRARGTHLFEAYKQPLETALISYFQKQVALLLERLKT